MVKHVPVSIRWQTVFAVIPYVSIYGFYRIEKLRMGLLLQGLFFILGIIFGIIDTFFGLPSYTLMAVVVVLQIINNVKFN